MSKIELLITLVKEAVKKCYTDDKTLIERNMEQASVARIFYYMQRKIDTNIKFKQLREYNLDCEYNKNMYNLACRYRFFRLQRLVYMSIAR